MPRKMAEPDKVPKRMASRGGSASVMSGTAKRLPPKEVSPDSTAARSQVTQK